MHKIDRRRFLTAAAATTACTAVAPLTPASAAHVLPAAPRPRSGKEQIDAWFVARERPRHALGELKAPAKVEEHVDFWSKPSCNISYTRHLPPEIVQGVLWLEKLPHPVFKDTLEYIDCACRIYGSSSQETMRQFMAHLDGFETLGSTLRSMILEDAFERAQRRVALVALDSIGYAAGEPRWSDIIPLLRDFYDRIIGLCHLEQRGLCHSPAWMSEETM